MTKIELEINDNIVTAINKIKVINDTGIELIIPQGSVLFDNILSLKLLEKYAEERNISLQLFTEDAIGNNLISMLNGKGGNSNFLSENISDIESLEELPVEDNKKIRENKLPKLNISIPKINLKKPSVILIGIPLVIIGAYYYAGKTLPRANAKITVYSQPLTRSLTIKVSSAEETSTDNKILKGYTLSTNVDGYKEIETTGERLVGEKADGEIKIYNKTSDEIELEKGTELAYKETSTDLIYRLKDSVTIPPKEDSTDLESMTPGTATVEIEASEIGESYNIDEGSKLEFEDYKKSELEGKSSEDIDGGKSEVVKTVAEKDHEDLSTTLLDESTKSAEELLKKQATDKQKIISGSTQSTKTNENFNFDIGDEATKVSLTQSVYAEGLSYSEEDLNNLLDSLVEDLIPEGFVLSKENREVSIEVLGNSTNSVLSSKEADIQVTLKTHVVPDINTESIKERILGKKPAEAQEIISSIKNIKTYEFNLAPSIPLFQRVPKNPDKVYIEVETN